MEACAQIRERLSEIKGLGHPNQYGLFLMDEDPKKGVWLEPGRTLEHYLLRDNVSKFYFGCFKYWNYELHEVLCDIKTINILMSYKRCFDMA